MENTFSKMLNGYQTFRNRYASGDASVMRYLSHYGQQPKVMVIACCDARVDPALILQCDPGDLFVIRNVANIVPPYEKDQAHHGTSAALEFGIEVLKVSHVILLGHSQCGGIQALVNNDAANKNDFINDWVSLIASPEANQLPPDEYAKQALKRSRQNCLSFPWIKNKFDQQTLLIHLWFFDIEKGQIFTYSDQDDEYKPLEVDI